jgi:ABC-2 type transport system ATP-binding protein
MLAIATENLTKIYQRKKKALSDCSLEVAQGQIFSLLGPNGAGKTTLVKLLLGIVKPTRGKASILGMDISDIRTHFHIGYLPENHHFPEYLTGNHLLKYFGQMSGCSNTYLSNQIPQLLATVNLAEWGNTQIRKYSKGMKQRLGIAQALINDPKILFLDEPTDGIDPLGRRQIRDLLLQLKENGKTVFLNSHLLSEVERVSDSLAILQKGEIIRHGTIDALLGDGQTYSIKSDADNAVVWKILETLSLSPFTENGALCFSANHQELNLFIDTLRNKDILIHEVTARRSSLEDYFIDVIAENK